MRSILIKYNCLFSRQYICNFFFAETEGETKGYSTEIIIQPEDFTPMVPEGLLMTGINRSQRQLQMFHSMSYRLQISFVRAVLTQVGHSQTNLLLGVKRIATFVVTVTLTTLAHTITRKASQKM